MAAMLGLAGPAGAAQSTGGTININLPAGSGHNYTGTWNPCTGDFVATGTTVGYAETVTGNFKDGILTYTSVYSGDVNDGTGMYNPYMYSLDAVADSSGVFVGTYRVTKTSTPGGVTTDAETGSAVGTVDAVSSAAGCGTHGQYVSGAAKSGVTGKALATIARDNTKVGPYLGG
jgi:hypothetical protein